jgi:hypothetical protein
VCKETYTVGAYIKLAKGGGGVKISEIDKMSMREFSRCETSMNAETLSEDAVNIAIAGSLQRIASSLEAIERHMAFNNGTLEGLTRNYDPRMSR